MWWWLVVQIIGPMKVAGGRRCWLHCCTSTEHTVRQTDRRTEWAILTSIFVWCIVSFDEPPCLSIRPYISVRFATHLLAIFSTRKMVIEIFVKNKEIWTTSSQKRATIWRPFTYFGLLCFALASRWSEASSRYPVQFWWSETLSPSPHRPRSFRC